MVIECIVICMDNSDYMRNEDYIPSRLMAQCEAADFIVQAKLRSHPENHVALVTFSNHEVVAHLTTNQTKLLTEMYRLKVGGSLQLIQGLSVAQLVLKHRLVKNHRCRIIAFVGSPVKVSENEIQNLGKRFKKENVAVDVVCFGGEHEGSKELEELIKVLNGLNGLNNKFIVVPSGANITDSLVSTIIGGNANRGAEETHHYVEDDDEDLRAALAMSLRESGMPGPGTNPIVQGLPPTVPFPTGIQDGNQLSDDEQLALAIQLSIQQAERDQQTAAPQSEQPNQPERVQQASAVPPSEQPNLPERNVSSSPSPPRNSSSNARESVSNRKNSSPRDRKNSGAPNTGTPNSGKRDQGSNGKSETPKK